MEEQKNEVAASTAQENTKTTDVVVNPAAASESSPATAPVRKTPAWKYARITIDEFRRRYFFDGCRPKRRDVKRWIEEGTAEGVKLGATLIDGKYFIQIMAAETFLTACRSATAPTKPSVRHTEPGDWRTKKTNLELRRLGYKFM